MGPMPAVPAGVCCFVATCLLIVTIGICLEALPGCIFICRIGILMDLSVLQAYDADCASTGAGSNGQ